MKIIFLDFDGVMDTEYYDHILSEAGEPINMEPQTEPRKRRKEKPTDFQQVPNLGSGENRIRTCEPVLPVTRFPGVPLQPLEHLSFKKPAAKVQLSYEKSK